MNAWRLFVAESSTVNEIAHIPGPPAMLTITAALILASLFLLFRLRRFNAWWCFVIYGAVMSAIPASLTTDSFHMLRLAALPVFLLVLTIPAVDWLTQSDVVETRGVSHNDSANHFSGIVVPVALPSKRAFTGACIFSTLTTTTILPTALTTRGRSLYISRIQSPGIHSGFWRDVAGIL